MCLKRKMDFLQSCFERKFPYLVDGVHSFVFSVSVLVLFFVFAVYSSSMGYGWRMFWITLSLYAGCKGFEKYSGIPFLKKKWRLESLFLLLGAAVVGGAVLIQAAKQVGG